MMLGKRVIKSGYQAKHDNMLALEAEIGNTTAAEDKATDNLDNLGKDQSDKKREEVREQMAIDEINTTPYNTPANSRAPSPVSAPTRQFNYASSRTSKRGVTVGRGSEQMRQYKVLYRNAWRKHGINKRRLFV